MRPIRLDMANFAAFRESTCVDFAGAEYFALVGPTGAGKSTVIDAMTFALYGSVPRWDDRRTVALALSPTANRGTVRLLFDVGSRRYVVARELRRSAAGAVTVRNARLERLLNPAAGPDGETEVLAADSGVSKAVEELLGLPFEQFCVCVVLPQGDFAQFLHAKPADRQKTLTRILGLGVYETIAKQAGAEANAQRQRAELLTEQLEQYLDVDEATLRVAEEQDARLAVLVERVAAALSSLNAADAAVADARRAVERLDAERVLLGGVRCPPGVSELAGRVAGAAGQVAAARAGLAAAEDEDTAARDALAAAPERALLERLRHDHAELARLRTAQPGLRGALSNARGLAETATAEAADAAEACDAARAAVHGTAAACAAARDDVERLSAERDLLVGLRVPDRVSQLAEAQKLSADGLANARFLVAQIEAAESRIRATVDAAPKRAPLEQARRDCAALSVAEGEQDAARERKARAATRHAEAAAALAAAERELAAARGDHEKLARTDHVAALRPGLRVHQPCPVCERPVVTLPPPVDAGGLPAADQRLRDAADEVDKARACERAAAESEHRVAAELDAVDTRIATLRVGLAEAPGSASDAEVALARLDELVGTAEEVSETARQVRRLRDQCEALGRRVARWVAEAEAELRAARDPLVALGAPTPDPADLAGSWATLSRWAARAATERATQLAEANRSLAEAEAAHTEAECALRSAGDRAKRVRQVETEALRAEHDAHGELDRALRRVAELDQALATAPTDAEAAARLSALDDLDARARAADSGLRAARATLVHAQAETDAVAEEQRQAWRYLRAARDPVVALGAPSHVGDDLVAAWQELISWALREVERRDQAYPAATDALTHARAAYDQAQAALADELRAHDVPIQPGQPLATVASSAVAAARERARAAATRLRERRAAAERLLADRDAARTAHEVAKMLAALLRSDAFPRWLVASALDILVVDASRSLAELSGGQFELTHADGEFLVVDHADADARRPVKTLSGGETFQASLALALALSEQLSTLASAGAARLDSIFLDEGFGTLDEANLEIVASTLENLASCGDRTVGVVTHVAALAERVPVRFVVSRDQRTASIAREGT